VGGKDAWLGAGAFWQNSKKYPVLTTTSVSTINVRVSDIGQSDNPVNQEAHLLHGIMRSPIGRYQIAFGRDWLTEVVLSEFPSCQRAVATNLLHHG